MLFSFGATLKGVGLENSDEARPFVRWRVHHDISRARAPRGSPLARLDVARELLSDEAAQAGRGAEPGR